MKKSFCMIISVLLSIVCLSGCVKLYLYDEQWILGKTTSQIIERYGEFYQGPYHPSYNLWCFYLHYRASRGFAADPMFLKIKFNEYGIATSCFEERGEISG